MTVDLAHLYRSHRSYCRTFFYELIFALLNSQEDSWAEILKLFQQPFENPSADREQLASALVDTIWIIDLQMDGPEEAATRSRLADILHCLLQEQLVPHSLAMERLNADLLELAKAIQSAALFNKKQIRINTAMFYKQQKFNLLHEETEGFAKLILHLNNWPADGDPAALFKDCVSLIGYFDLDPARALDLVLDAFTLAASTKSALFLAIIRLFDFPMPTLSALVAFKLKMLKEKPGSIGFEGFMKVIAFLVKDGLLTMDHVYPNLLPSDEEYQKEDEKCTKALMSASRKGVSLAPSTGAADEALVPTALGYTDVPITLLDFDAKSHQKPALAAALLDLGLDSMASSILQRLPMLPRLSVNLTRSLCNHIRSLIKADDWNAVMHWLHFLPPGQLHIDPLLFTKLARYLQTIADESTVLHMLRDHLMPGLSLATSNPALAYELWNSLLRFPYPERYQIYAMWRNHVYESSPGLKYARAVTLFDVRRVMRRLAKENVKQLGRLLGKLSHGNPTIFFPILLDQLQAYDNLIQPIVESLKYITPLAMDVLMYTILDVLKNNERDRLKEDGTNISSWLQNLASFAGALAKRYNSVDLVPLIQFIFSQLHNGNTFDLVLLSELLQKMTGSESQENIPERVLLSQSGGPLLRESISSTAAHTSTNANAEKNRPLRRTSQRLLGALVSSGLAIRLWLSLAKSCVWAVQDTDVPHLKMLGLLADQCHDAFLQYSDFITAHAIEAGLSLGDLPSLSELITVHGVEPDYASYINRTWQTLHTGRSGFELLVDSAQLADQSDSALTELCSQSFWGLQLDDLTVPASLYNEEIARLKTMISTAEPSPLLNELEKLKWREAKEKAPELLSGLETELQSRQESAGRVSVWFQEHRSQLLRPEAGRMESITLLLHRFLLPRAIFSPLDALYSARFLVAMHSAGVPTFSSLSCYDKLIDHVGGYIFSLTEREAHCLGRFLGEVLGQLHAWHSSKELYEDEAIGGDRPGFFQRWHRADAKLMEVDEEHEEGQVSAQDGEDTISNQDDESSSMQVEQPSSMEIEQPQTAQFTGEPLGYEDYRHVLFKWHLKLHRACISALESGDYQLIRNTIILLSRLSLHFPALRKIGASLEKAVARVQAAEEGKREDLKLLATRCLAVLQSRKNQWLPEDRFHHVEGKNSSAAAPQSPARSDATAGSKRAAEEAEDAIEGRVKKLKIAEQQSQSGKKSAEEIEQELRRKLEDRKKALEAAKVNSPTTASSSSSQRQGREKREQREERPSTPRETREERPRSARDQREPSARSDQRESSARGDQRESSSRGDQRQASRGNDQRGEAPLDNRGERRGEERDRRRTDYRRR